MRRAYHAALCYLAACLLCRRASICSIHLAFAFSHPLYLNTADRQLVRQGPAARLLSCVRWCGRSVVQPPPGRWLMRSGDRVPRRARGRRLPAGGWRSGWLEWEQNKRDNTLTAGVLVPGVHCSLLQAAYALHKSKHPASLAYMNRRCTTVRCRALRPTRTAAHTQVHTHSSSWQEETPSCTLHAKRTPAC